MADIITTPRSLMVTRQLCAKKRYLCHHADGHGWDVVNNGLSATDFGIALHEMLAQVMTSAEPLEADQPPVPVWYAIKLSKSALDSHVIRERRMLLDLLVYGWRKYRLPSILSAYNILTVEKEDSVVFDPEAYLPGNLAPSLKALKVPIRFDVVLKLKADPDHLVILDWKTTSAATQDWNNALDNSLQSCIYVEAARQLYPNKYIVGIGYEGLVKGRVEVDGAKSSPYNGLPIHYGSFLYGWQAKNGSTYKEYSTGRTRLFLPPVCTTTEEAFDACEAVYGGLEMFFPNTIPWKPKDAASVVAQQIVAENRFMADVELYEQLPEPMKYLYENTLFEQSLDACYKYGAKHACMCKDICHGGVVPSQEPMVFVPRVSHHSEIE